MQSNHTSEQSHNAGVRKSTRQLKHSTMHRAVITAVVAALIVVGAVVALSFLRSDKPDANRYQAVFLDTGEVFFGKLKNTDGPYLTLDKAFYTKKQEIPADATAEQKAATSNNVSLVKVGDEVYGPLNSLHIKAEQVKYWQDLKADSKVAKAIDSDK